MNLYILIPIVVALIVLGVFLRLQFVKRSWLWEEKNKKEWRQQEVQRLGKLVDRAEAGDAEARQELADNNKTYESLSGNVEGLSARVSAIVDDVRAKAQYTERHDQISALLAQQAKLTDEDFDSQFTVALELLGVTGNLGYGNDKLMEAALGVSYRSVAASVKELVLKHCDKLSSEAGESFMAFQELSQLLANSHKYRNGLERAGISDIPYPEGWNGWVAQYYANPSLWDFHAQDYKPQPGELRLRAAAALREPNIPEAKLVFAYTHQYEPRARMVREELDQLAAELAKMVEAYNDDNGITANGWAVGAS